MKRSFAVVGCALLLAPFVTLAQEEAPAEEVEVVEEAPAEEAAPAGAAPAEAAPADGGVEEVADAPAPEAPAEEAAEEEPYRGQGVGFVDAYWLPTTEVDLGGAFEDRGDGMGGRAQYQFWRFLAGSVEYTFRKFDESDTEITDTRAAIGAVARNNGGDFGGLFLEYQKIETDADDIDGYGLQGRIGHAVNDWFEIYGGLGYLQLQGDVEDYTAHEFTAGLLFKLSSNAGLLVDWRRTSLEGKDSDTRSSIEDVRVGARVSWGDLED